MAEYQLRRLQALLRHAVKNVPFYRLLYQRHGISPKNIRTFEDIGRLPLISKTDFRELPPEDTIASGVDINRLITHTTSGTTGVPTTPRRTWVEERLLNLFRWRGKFYHGIRPWDNCVLLSLGQEPQVLPHRLVSALGLFRIQRIDVLAQPEELLQQLIRIKPDVIFGYPSALAGVAGIMNRQHRALIKCRLITTGGESLTPFLRRTITKGFGARVFEIYGSYEFNYIAWECNQNKLLHTCDDNVIVELLKGGRPAREGETGDVVCTALHSYAMPLIRFRLGDTAVKGPEQCSCGSPYDTIERIDGRVTDYFILPSGKKIHPYRFDKPIFQYASPWIRQYQLIQTESDRVLLKLVPLEPGGSFPLAALEKEGQEILGPEMRFQVTLVRKIQPMPSGKIPTYQCLIPQVESVLNATGNAKRDTARALEKIK